MTGFKEQYQARTQKSFNMFQDANKYLPGGVAGNGKFLEPYPVYVHKAKGAKLWDIDGNEYTDLLMGAGVHILGHSPKFVLDAVMKEMETGVHYYMPAEAEVKLGKKVCQLMSAIDMVRFVNTGSESTQMALRTARAYKKKDKIAKFEGNFHGQHESVLISTLNTAGEPNNLLPHVDSAGIPKAAAQDVLILPYNDIDGTLTLIRKDVKNLGAVIIEPVSAFGLGSISADKEFLKAVRESTEENDIPLIFDEVVTNFRLALGGATEFFGVKPDLVCLGKIVGGGFAIGGYGGRRDIMDKMVTPETGLWDLKEQIFQSGCFSGNPISMTAGLVVLEELEKRNFYPRLNSITEKLRKGISEIGERLKFEMLVSGVTSILQIHLGIKEIRNKRDAMKANKPMAKKFHLGLRANGIMASAHPLFLSTEHTEKDVNHILEITEIVLKEMRRSGEAKKLE
ncbi:MAG: aspartate aminotransferase family protein [Candidatus Thorarchaeota archaeon]|jgi:glutamate-1-semialdehyde 2,1-aminomutase